MFGGFAPLPIRLGGTLQEGWSASQMLRMAGDVAATGRTLPFAWVTVTRGTGGAAPVVTRASCRAPTATITVTGNHPDPVAIAFEAAPEDESEQPWTLSLKSARASRHNSTDPVLVALSGPQAVTVDSVGSGGLDFTVAVYGSWNQHRPEDFGGTPNKRDTRTEVTPYAWNWYRDVGATLGSSFGTQQSGLLHSRKVAIARALAGAERAEERVRCSSTPDTATITLSDWATALQVPHSDAEPDWLVRQRCSVLYAAHNGGSLANLSDAVSDLLGSRFVSVVSVDIDDAPGVWPLAWDLGGGVWCESRRKILVDVRHPGDANDPNFSSLINLQLIKLLDRMTPATVYFDWTTTETSGFYLDISLLDFTGL
ncbi:MAG TPA: hypothetical protein VGK73_08720 [Polyangiaceae bacterium]